MQPAPRSAREDIRGALARILAYMGGLAVLGILGASLLPIPAIVASPDPPPLPKWIDVERPNPAFELVLPELGGAATRYAIRRRDVDGARKDVMTWGDAAGDTPYVRMEIYRAGSAGERFIDAASEVAARIVDFTVTDDVKPVGTMDSKFGTVPLVDFAIAAGGQERRCLGFARTFATPLMEIAGWYCSSGNEVVNRTTLACALDRLTIVSTGGDPRLGELFAQAEIKRSFCGRRNPILAATSERGRRAMSGHSAKLRGRFRVQ